MMWDEIAQAEIATADGPSSVEGLCRVASAYEQIGFPDAALAVLRKADAFGVEGKTVLPTLLGALRRQRRFVELNAAVQSGLVIPDRNPDLRRELAMALSSLGQIPAAEKEWASSIRSGCMSETDWLECARFVINCADTPSLTQAMVAIDERARLTGQGLVGYCLVRQLVDRDMAVAQHTLCEIDPSRIPDAEIQLALAILAWRLRDYARAEMAATLAASSSDAPSASKKILASIRSFAGDFSLLRKVSMPALRAVGERVLKSAPAVKKDAAAWGFVRRHGPDSFEMNILDPTAEPAIAVPEELDPVATFSILSDEPYPDPFHVLCGVDWSWPHVMLQRKPGGEALHFFVEAHGHKDWLWEEVSPEACDAGSDHTCALRSQQSATWIEAMRELSQEPD
jgi:hypothetical protein